MLHSTAILTGIEIRPRNIFTRIQSDQPGLFDIIYRSTSMTLPFLYAGRLLLPSVFFRPLPASVLLFVAVVNLG